MFAAPGNLLPIRSLADPVVSCVAAAAAKGIPVEHELKTLILDTSTGLLALHLRGDQYACLRSIKEALAVKQACLASVERLGVLGLTPGTISAVLEPVWSMRHLVDNGVLMLDFVSTNNGTPMGYFFFQPSLLKEALQIEIGNFAR